MTGTHLFNAMPPIHHRAPGTVAALLTGSKAGDAGVELIADGVHLADGTVDMAYNRRSFAVTDAMAAAGMADGSYELGSLPVTVTDGVARVDSGAIAGGTSTWRSNLRVLPRATAQRRRFGLPPPRPRTYWGIRT